MAFLCNLSLRSSRISYSSFQRTIRVINKNNVSQQQQQCRMNTTNKKNNSRDEDNQTMAYYMSAVAVFVFGVSYASVPLYKAFCQMTGFGGTTQRVTASETKVTPVEGANLIKIYFTASVHSEMPWNFTPTQREVKVIPGETALAFYTVRNNSNYPITGVATYNVYPPKAGLYFNKIQCFCFEEQRLGPYEEIDMPVLFFIDPDILKDPSMENTSNITLSYTFFKTGDEKEQEEPEVKKST